LIVAENSTDQKAVSWSADELTARRLEVFDMETTKFLLDEKALPESWYNVVPDLPFGLDPPLNPATREPVGPEAFAPIFPEAIIRQEVTGEPHVPIPEEVREIYSLWRPTPLLRARRLERFLDTPAHIYYKYEGGSPTGSHKPNTAVPQAYYNREEGVRRLTTETGAGQWGSSLAFACGVMGLECTVYMVRVSYDQKPYRRIMMQTYGAEVHASPTELTQAGQNILEEHPDSPGSLGIAISEAVEDAVKNDDAKYSLGSVLNHVLLHQTVIGQEAVQQMEMAGEYPDVVVGCVGGGSNFAGISFPFIRENLRNDRSTRILAVEPASCPTLTRGRYVYDFGDTAGTTPLMKMYTLGHSFVPAGIHAGGLRYHGDSPVVSALVHEGLIEARAYAQNETFESGVLFAQTEGIIPAPEVAHAIRATIDLALEAKEAGERKVILFNLCGHGHFDLGAYEQYLAGNLVDLEHSEEEIERAVAGIPN
jgi:tryptophan synthase beta chain